MNSSRLDKLADRLSGGLYEFATNRRESWAITLLDAAGAAVLMVIRVVAPLPSARNWPWQFTFQAWSKDVSTQESGLLNLNCGPKTVRLWQLLYALTTGDSRR